MLDLGKYKRALIIGLGKSGFAAAKFLHGKGLEVCVSEARANKDIPSQERAELDRLGIAFETGGHTEQFLQPGCLVVPSPGVSLQKKLIAQAQKMGCDITGELGLAAGRFKVPVIAVTGTNGKTTVTGLIGHLLQQDNRNTVFVGGNIGCPLLDFFQDENRWEYAVLELSSFQLDLSGDFRPDIALFLNLSPDHLDRHHSFAEYLAAKRRIFLHQKESDFVLLGHDDQTLADMETGAGTCLYFGSQPHCDAAVSKKGVILECQCAGMDLQEAYDLRSTRLESKVNRLNAAAALLAARLCGCSKDSIRSGLQTFVPPDHRMQEVARRGGVVFVDDSKATNTGAMVAAVSSFDAPVILIAGGQSKGCDFNPYKEAIAQKVKHLILLGEDAIILAGIFSERVACTTVTNMDKAVTLAVSIAEPGDIVLLAPGCASFDMFSGFAERGRVFSDAVLKVLTEKENAEVN